MNKLVSNDNVNVNKLVSNDNVNVNKLVSNDNNVNNSNKSIISNLKNVNKNNNIEKNNIVQSNISPLSYDITNELVKPPINLTNDTFSHISSLNKFKQIGLVVILFFVYFNLLKFGNKIKL